MKIPSAARSEAVLSQHWRSWRGVEQQWRSALQLMQSIYAFVPQRVVVDAHPGYRSTQWAASLPCRWRQCCITMPTPRHAGGAPLADGGDVIALTLDGIGMGENGALWGGSACGSTIANANILADAAVALRGDWRHASRGEIAGPLWPLSLTGRIIRRPPPCASATQLAAAGAGHRARD
ncbi:hypothetical protein J4734_07605 [Klebsiella pneumoniae]|uniref:HypF Kae1-like domain-containing protein n=1 Tax=Klebsiella pneumoniae TaxID=573 RepID=A0A939SSC6_KLEPN|nr:hypothetical protein [Klebsiella pneumoniae]